MEIKRKRLSAKKRNEFYKMFNGHCAYCGTEITLRGMQIDHKRPLRIGGEGKPENMLPACRSCNHYKHILDVEGFREYLAGIPKRVKRTRLKPCPFCGKKKLLEIKTVERKDRTQCKFTGQVTCLMCFASAHTHGFEWTEDEAREEAIKAWNRRVGL